LNPAYISLYSPNADECERFVKGGLPVDMKDSGGDTALDWAVFACKANVVWKLIQLGADVNHVDQQGFTPLMYTAWPLQSHWLNGTPEERNGIAQVLIDHGADVNHAMGDGRAIGSGQTTLHFAAADRNAGLVRILLAAGARRDVKSNQGYTPLDVAKFPDYAPNDEVISELQKLISPTTSR